MRCAEPCRREKKYARSSCRVRVKAVREREARMRAGAKPCASERNGVNRALRAARVRESGKRARNETAECATQR